MRKWNLTTNDPGAYTIAADARCGPTDYTNDHIWELALRGGDPPGLSVETTFGLRARQLKIFPRFTEGDNAISDPDQFEGAPKVHQFFPNYLSLSCSPYTGIDVNLEYWVPDSHAIAGRIHIKNTRLSARLLCLELVCMLSSGDGGERMVPEEIEAATVLSGQSSELAPTLFMTGGPTSGAGPYPALTLDIELPPGGERSFIWVLASLDDPLDSFKMARQVATRHWDKDIARLEIINGGLIEIETGDPAWDAAFALSQKCAYNLIVGPSDHLPHASFVSSRQPDHGYSRRGDGSDYGHLWNGQTPLETDFLVSFLLPAFPEMAKHLFNNFLSTQKQGGFIDWKPGLGGQLGGVLATPILAQTAWRIYQATEDKQFLSEVYTPLLSFVQAWFSADQDRDGDGIPEWSHLMQSGIEEHPTFSQGPSWSQGVDITFSESPALCALLHNEIHILMRMASILDRTLPISSLQSLADLLSSAVEAAWDQDAAMYRTWDSETHFSSSKQHLAERIGPGEIYLEKYFEYPVRLLVSITGQSGTPRQANVFIHGENSAGKNIVEHFSSEQIQWRLQQTFLTSQRVYAHLEYLDIREIGPDDRVAVEVVDLANLDYSLFLPLFARIPTAETAALIVRQALLDPGTFWGAYGVPLCADSGDSDRDSSCDNTSIIWCSLIGKGLLNYGYRKEAADLVSRLMSAITTQLSKHKAFAHAYHVVSGRGVGERNSLQGLAPLSLFLNTLGVQIISPTKVTLEGHNPFPWPVTVKYRGLTILRQSQKTRVTFPGGQTAVIKSTDAQTVTLTSD
jgi:hypothetical protein